MANLRPFYGIRYDPGLAGRLGDVICLPYDIISAELQSALHERSPYNQVRLEYGLELAGDNHVQNKYTRAAATFREWVGKGILKAESKPALYLHKHTFRYRGQKHHRWGLLAPIRLHEWGPEVRPHEYTMSAPKRDRLSLMHACPANLSPIFALYPDPGQTISAILAQIASQGPAVEGGADFQGDEHSLWPIVEPGVLQRLLAGFQSQSLYIADGHHRYETALAYQREELQRHPRSTGEEAFNFVLANLVAFRDSGLLIMPQHRLLRGAGLKSLDTLEVVIGRFFETEELPLDTPLPPGDGVVGVVGWKPERLTVLRRREHIPYGDTPLRDRSPAYRSLGVSLLEGLILEGWLGSGDRAGVEIVYTPDEEMARRRVSQAEYQLAFLLNPVSAESIRLVADVGERLPRKSTYFYPKPPAGLVIHSLSD